MFIRICSFLAAVLLLATGFANPNPEENLRIGLLRHLTIEEAAQLPIDTYAEELIVAEARMRGHQIDFIHPQHYDYATSGDQNYDVIISRAEINNFNEHLTDSYFRALDYFENLGVPVINSLRATLNAQDKFRTLQLAKNAGLTVPATFIVGSPQAIEQLLEKDELHYPFFVKKPYGGAGNGVFSVRNHESLLQILEKNFQANEAILVEERIDLETDEEGNVRDMRVWVVRDSLTQKAKFIGGMYRTAAKGHYLTNVAAGGHLSLIDLPYDPKLIQLAEQALEAIEGDVAGIDVGRDKNGDLYLIEVNISFYTSKTFHNMIGTNVWKLVLDLAEARAGLHKAPVVRSSRL